MEKLRIVKIDTNEGEILSITLKDVLGCIIEGEKLNWALLWVEAIGELENGQLMLDFEQEINESKKGIIIKWEDLQELSTKVTQIIDFLLVGDENIENVKKYPDNEDMYSKCYYTIELIDSSYWIIHSKDDMFLKRIINNLKGAGFIAG